MSLLYLLLREIAKYSLKGLASPYQIFLHLP